jgi:hypothetical protein
MLYANKWDAASYFDWSSRLGHRRSVGAPCYHSFFIVSKRCCFMALYCDSIAHWSRCYSSVAMHLLRLFGFAISLVHCPRHRAAARPVCGGLYVKASTRIGDTRRPGQSGQRKSDVVKARRRLLPRSAGARSEHGCDAVVGIQPTHRGNDQHTAAAVLDVCGMDDGLHQQAICVAQDVATRWSCSPRRCHGLRT